MKKYIPVLCCSKSKTVKSDIFSYNNQHYKFVASPDNAPKNGVLYCTPDDKIPGSGKKWRDLINKQNHKDLTPAFELYKNPVYSSLYEKYGKHFYIFSAGWGIVRSTFKLPYYNITYSAQSNKLGKRTKDMHWNDYNHLLEDIDTGVISSDAVIVLFAGMVYLDHFYEFASASKIKNKKIIFHKSAKIKKIPGFEYKHYDKPISTNWFYNAARDFFKILT